jgi:hypothetical protein
LTRRPANAKSPFHTIDHPENVAAVFYVHMWVNPAWQAAYRDALGERFAFSETSFAEGVVIQALEPASMWMNDTDLHLAIRASIVTSMLAETPGRLLAAWRCRPANCAYSRCSGPLHASRIMRDGVVPWPCARCGGRFAVS